MLVPGNNSDAVRSRIVGKAENIWANFDLNHKYFVHEYLSAVTVVVQRRRAAACHTPTVVRIKPLKQPGCLPLCSLPVC